MTTHKRRIGRTLTGVAVIILVGGGTAVGATGDPGSAGPVAAAAPQPPPVNAGFDYQISGGYPPPAGVSIVSRDHGDAPAPGLYNICYINGFQAQTEAARWWKANHDDLLLKKNGRYVVDPDWNEILLDISTPSKRAGILGVVGRWIDECAAKGFDAVEADNLDSWTRSKGVLRQEHAVAHARLLTDHAHAQGLASAQKNTVELAGIGRGDIGFDFAIAEECADYEIDEGVAECQGYIDGYGDHVIAVEYDTAHFAEACAGFGSRISVVLRDRDVTEPGSATYMFQTC